MPFSFTPRSLNHVNRLIAALAILSLAWCSSARALDHVTTQVDDREEIVSGRVMVTAEDGGLLVQTPDGTLVSIEPKNIVSRREDAEPFRQMGRDELARHMLAELPSGFEAHSTSHYLICHNTSREYANWCGALFERLYKAFTNFWSRKGIKLHEPEFPLVAVIFNSRESYTKFSESELGKFSDEMIGYYSFRTNRVTMYDLTGIETLRAPGDRRSTSAQINLILSRPEAERVVATIIHEATHQIAFNSGLQTRFADIPLWMSEGIAVYFEAPDLSSAKGWRNVGGVNEIRLERFREYLGRRSSTSLKSLIADDKRFRNGETALDAYAEAWALNYYLIRHRPRQYVAYLKMLAEKPPLVWDDPQERLREFQAAFGENLGALDADFLRQMQKVR